MTIGFIFIVLGFIGLLFIMGADVVIVGPIDDTKKDKYDKYYRDLKRINQIKSTSDAYETYQANKLDNPYK